MKPETEVTSLDVISVIFGFLETSTIFGERMHCEQSSVGKVSDSWIMWPPMVGSFSTSTTSRPALARSSAL